MMYDKVCALLADQLGVDRADIRPETNVFDDLGADSLDLVELLTEIENEYNIIITDERARELTTVGDIAAFLAQLVGD